MTNNGTIIAAAVIAIGLMTSLLFVMTPAQAETNSAVRSACAKDVRKLCSAVLDDQKARRACRDSHFEELSADCKAAIKKQGGNKKLDAGRDKKQSEGGQEKHGQPCEERCTRKCQPGTTTYSPTYCWSICLGRCLDRSGKGGGLPRSQR